jgi:hypothetical protein
MSVGTWRAEGGRKRTMFKRFLVGPDCRRRQAGFIFANLHHHGVSQFRPRAPHTQLRLLFFLCDIYLPSFFSGHDATNATNDGAEPGGAHPVRIDYSQFF